MNKWTLSTIAILSAGTAFAGGIERSSTPLSDLYEDGNFVKFSYSYVSPDITGESDIYGELKNGNPGFGSPSFMLKADYGAFDLGVIVDQPWGASTDHPAKVPLPKYDEIGTRLDTGTVFIAPNTIIPAVGVTSAELTSVATTVVGKYSFNENFSAHAGLIAQTLDAELNLAGGVYKAETSQTTGYGGLIGFAYERPEIALRFDVTYRSSIKHDDIKVRDSGIIFGEGASQTPFATSNTTTEIETPESVDVNFQTGIAADTLLMLGARWVNWSEFAIKTDNYSAGNDGDAIVSYDEDTITYNIGLGRKINDQLSVLAGVSWETATGEDASYLSPADGNTTISLGAKYTIMDGLELSGGLAYSILGDTTDTTLGGKWEDNKATAFGISIKKTF